jgi:sec-independent protein translocase protein TatC
MSSALDPEADENPTPLLEHLIELRSRLLYACGAFLIAFLACYAVSDRIFVILTAPLAEAIGPGPGRRMIFTGLTEAFFTYLEVAFWAGACLSFPVFAVKVWRFLAPALYRNEWRAFLPYALATPVLFALGAAMAYYVIFPLAWGFFLSFETTNPEIGLPIVLEARVAEYLDLVTALILAFGIAFQLPVALTLLARAGVLASADLVRFRRFAIVAIFTAAAILTPPDVISQIGLALPLLALYEASILAARWIERRRSSDDGASAPQSRSD